MSDHLDIEEFFKESLKDVEYPASSEVWNSISSSLGTSASAASSAGSGSFLGLGKVGTIITVASTVGLISAGAVYLTMDHKIKKLEEKSISSSEQKEIEPQVANDEKQTTYDFNEVSEQQPEKEPKTNNDTKEKYIVIEDPKPSEKTQNKLITVDKEVHEDPAINEEDSTETYVIAYEEKEEETSSENKASVVSVIKTQNDVQPNVVELNVSKISGYAPLEVIFSSSGNGSKDFWDFGDGTTSENVLPKHTFTDAGEYTVRLTTEFPNGETKTVTKIISVKQGSSINKIPNVFSPNGDGYNDEYYLEMEGIVYFHGFVLDLEGNTVFEFHDQDQHWMGKDKYGEDLPEGKYIFTYKAEGIDGNFYKDKVIVTLKK